jgi:hypothetical protein
MQSHVRPWKPRPLPARSVRSTVHCCIAQHPRRRDKCQSVNAKPLLFQTMGTAGANRLRLDSHPFRARRGTAESGINPAVSVLTTERLLVKLLASPPTTLL